MNYTINIPVKVEAYRWHGIDHSMPYNEPRITLPVIIEDDLRCNDCGGLQIHHGELINEGTGVTKICVGDFVCVDGDDNDNIHIYSADAFFQTYKKVEE